MTTAAISVTRRIIVTTRAPGFHAWPEPNPAVAYLGSKHRHQFSVRAEFTVQHDNRDIEFHMAQVAVVAALHNCGTVMPGGIEFGAQSCEMIAEQLWSWLPEVMRRACTAVEVWEDRENGARVEFAWPA